MATCAQCNECPPVPVLIPVCADPEFCSEITNSRCVIYTGVSLPTLGVVTGDRIDAILLKIEAALILLNATDIENL